MTFQKALKILGIEDYAERIFKSNSHGELSHLENYIILAEFFNGDAEWFRGWFEDVVEFAEQNWERPQSVFQHINQILIEYIRRLTGK